MGEEIQPILLRIVDSNRLGYIIVKIKPVEIKNTLSGIKQLWDKFDFVFTPKHGSWLNMAEIELNVLMGQCLNRRSDNIEDVRREATAWQKYRNKHKSIVNWQFTAGDARIKLARLYPSIGT